MKGDATIRLFDIRFALQRSTGTKRMGSERKSSSSKGRSASSEGIASRKTGGRQTSAHRQFAICICSDGYPASLELRKLYRVVDDSFADQHSMVRVIDESGEDYLFPAEYFVRVSPPQAVEKQLREIA